MTLSKRRTSSSSEAHDKGDHFHWMRSGKFGQVPRYIVVDIQPKVVSDFVKHVVQNPTRRAPPRTQPSDLKPHLQGST